MAVSGTAKLPPNEGNAFYAEHRPTIWQRLGFGFCRAPRPDEDEYAEGFASSWFVTETFVHFGWVDRLRVLVSGNVHVQCAIKTDVQISRSRSTSAVGVTRPGHHRQGWT